MDQYNLWAKRMQISLKVHGDMDIGGVVALVILALVGLNFIRTARSVLHNLAHAVFILSKLSYSTKSTIFLHLSTTASFWLRPFVLSASSYHPPKLSTQLNVHIALPHNNKKHTKMLAL
jgi:hypothetical protein